MRRLAVFTAGALFAGCFTSSGEENALVSAPLSSTRLAGAYSLVDYLFEYGNGQRLDTHSLKLTGTLSIRADSTYLEVIGVGKDSTPTQGRIAQVHVIEGDNDRGELLMTLDGADSTASGKSAFSFNTDTLVLITEVSKERDTAKKGFRETAYYLRLSAGKRASAAD